MAINVNNANNQAAQLKDQVTKLQSARRQMQAYRASVSNSWQGKEVSYILTAIDRVIGDIDSAIRNLESLSTDIKNTAAQIKREEDAAAAAARAQAAKQQRLREAQNAYDAAYAELEALTLLKEELMIKATKGSIRDRMRALQQLQELEQTITEAEDKVESAANALRMAKR